MLGLPAAKVKAGAEDPSSAAGRLQSGSRQRRLLLTEVHSHLDHRTLPAAGTKRPLSGWSRPIEAEKLRAFRDEAAQTLGRKTINGKGEIK